MATTDANAMKQENEPTGLFGGSFDPVHCGHLDLVSSLMTRAGLQHVVFLPANVSPHKVDHPVTNAEHRLAMLRLAIRGRPEFSVSDIELRRSGVSYTIDTLRSLRERMSHPVLMMGTDTFGDLPSWKDPQEILRYCDLLIGARPGYPLKLCEPVVRALGPLTVSPAAGESTEVSWSYVHDRYGTRLRLVEVATPNISSTEIRRRLAQGESVKNMLPPEVEKYIMRNYLYQSHSHPNV